MKKPNANNKLRKLRGRIEALSIDILTLVEHRQAIAAEIGETKRDAGLPIHDPAREQALLKLLKARSTLPPQLVEDVFALLLAASIDIQADH